jgi:regulatory protein
MSGRRGARTGRGWDAAPLRTGGAPSDDRVRAMAAAATRSVAGEDSRAPVEEAELAREICLRQLAVRPRTRAELATALRRRGICDEIAAEVLDRYDDVGMIDDAAFARAWVTSRHHGRGLARRALADELRQRGVDAAAAGEALATLDDQTEAATARALVERKLRTATGSPEAVFRRLVSLLARKGYPAGVAVTAVRDALAVRFAEATELAERIDVEAVGGDERIDAEAVGGAERIDDEAVGGDERIDVEAVGEEDR